MLEAWKPQDHIILASSSRRRSSILDKAGIPFEIVAPHVDETPPKDSTPEEISISIAQRKGREVHDITQTSRLILACDTNVFLDGQMFGKAKDEEDAKHTLRTLSGKTHQAISGVCLIMGDEERTFAVSTDVTFFDLSEHDVDAYVRTGEFKGKAGAYAIQGLGMLLVSHINGDYYNVVGLPIARIVREMLDMRANGIDEMHEPGQGLHE